MNHCTGTYFSTVIAAMSYAAEAIYYVIGIEIMKRDIDIFSEAKEKLFLVERP